MLDEGNSSLTYFQKGGNPGIGWEEDQDKLDEQKEDEFKGEELKLI